MQTLGIFATIVAAVGGIFTFILDWFVKTQRETGRLEERNEQNKASTEALDRANVVLGEHRDPDDAAERLRRGDF